MVLCDPYDILYGVRRVKFHSFIQMDARILRQGRLLIIVFTKGLTFMSWFLFKIVCKNMKERMKFGNWIKGGKWFFIQCSWTNLFWKSQCAITSEFKCITRGKMKENHRSLNKFTIDQNMIFDWKNSYNIFHFSCGLVFIISNCLMLH